MTELRYTADDDGPDDTGLDDVAFDELWEAGEPTELARTPVYFEGGRNIVIRDMSVTP